MPARPRPRPASLRPRPGDGRRHARPQHRLGTGLQLRVGVNSGSAVAGVVGSGKFSYDVKTPSTSPPGWEPTAARAVAVSASIADSSGRRGQKVPLPLADGMRSSRFRPGDRGRHGRRPMGGTAAIPAGAQPDSVRPRWVPALLPGRSPRGRSSGREPLLRGGLEVDRARDGEVNIAFEFLFEELGFGREAAFLHIHALALPVLHRGLFGKL